jgi:hypothetical protein
MPALSMTATGVSATALLDGGDQRVAGRAGRDEREAGFGAELAGAEGKYYSFGSRNDVG